MSVSHELWCDESGHVGAETALIVAAIVVASISAWHVLGHRVSGGVEAGTGCFREAIPRTHVARPYG